MHVMPTYMDYMISPLPIRIFQCMVDHSKLSVKSLVILHAGHLPGRTLQRNGTTFDHWAFVYIGAGRGYYQAGDGPRQTVEAGTMFCLYPGTTFHYGPDQDGFWDEYYFTLEGERVQEWLANWCHQPETVKMIGIEEAFFSKMEMVFMLMESGIPANQDRASLALEALLYEMADRARQPAATSRSLFVHKLIGDLTDSVYQPLDSAAVAARHHISIPTLRRMVHEYTGYPLGEFVHRLKIAEAKMLLLRTDKTLKEIAAMLGYADVFYFSRLFKKVAEVSPRTYRARMG